MSAIVAIHCGRFVVVGSDTRVVWYSDAPTNTKLRKATDGKKEFCKLSASPVGLIGGTGSVRLGVALQRRVPEAIRAGTTWNDLLDIIAAEKAAVVLRNPTERPDDPHQGTGLMLTYLAADRSVRLVTYHPSQGHGLSGIPPGGAVAFVPNGREWASSLLPEDVRPVGPDESLTSSHLEHSVQLVRGALANAADHTRTVSRDSFIGVHLDTGPYWVRTYPPIRRMPEVSK